MKPVLNNSILGLALICLCYYGIKNYGGDESSPADNSDAKRIHVEIERDGEFPVVYDVRDPKELEGIIESGTIPKNLRDGERLVISAEGKIERERIDGTKTIALGGKIGINSATAEELETLPGIGPSLAQRIVEYRRNYGNFKTLGELIEVKGIGEKKFEALSELISLD